MHQNAIVAKDISKDFLIGAHSADTLRGRIENLLKAPGKKELFHALKNISFTVSEGDVFGIIGKNGAGKSTLLKIISRITYPTSGTIEIFGRVASLLEVGTGFHPELTGRENIYLNGSILGMKRKEINSLFDEIVNFAGVNKFLDTPVKHYSSGMYVRLAFAVAAHLRTDILIIDEVLAVGDSEFQKKCLGRMKDLASDGRTVIFVSHNMEAIQSLCNKCLLLEHGGTRLLGKPQEVISSYLSTKKSTSLSKEWKFNEAPGNQYAKLLKIAVCPAGPATRILLGEPFTIEFMFQNLFPGQHQFDVTYHLTNENGVLVLVSSTVYMQQEYITPEGSKYYASCHVPAKLLNEGIYSFSKIIFNRQNGDVVMELNDIFGFEVEFDPKGFFGINGRKEGVIRPVFKWDVSIDKA